MLAVLLFLFLVIGFIISVHGNIAYFLDWPSMIIFFGIILTGLLGKFGVKFYKRPKEDLLDAAGIFSIIGGVLGTIMGLIIMLQNLSDPSSIGVAMAVAHITTFYGLISFIACKVARRVK
jgi:flagellar motor component MotA